MTDDKRSSKEIKVPSLRQAPGGGTFFMQKRLHLNIKCSLKEVQLSDSYFNISASASDLTFSAIAAFWN